MSFSTHTRFGRKPLLWVLVALLPLAWFAACNSSPTGGIQKHAKAATAYAPLNLIVVLDLSDRLLNPNQPQRDIALLGMLADAFYQRQLRQSCYKSQDHLRVLVASQAGAQLAGDYAHLQFVPSGNGTQTRTAPVLRAFFARFRTSLDTLYQTATQGRQRSTDFPGADLWATVHHQLPDQLRPDAENVVVFLTDGYLDYERLQSTKQVGNRHNNSHFVTKYRNRPDWQTLVAQQEAGLLADTTLPNTRFVVLEMFPKTNWADELPFLKWMWADWAKQLGVPSPLLFNRQELPSLSEKLQNIVQGSS